MGSSMIVVLFLLGIAGAVLAGWWIHWLVGLMIGVMVLISIATLIRRARRGTTTPPTGGGACPPAGTPPAGTPPAPMTTWEKVGMIGGLIAFLVMITAIVIIAGMVVDGCRHVVDVASQPLTPTATSVQGFGTVGQIPTDSLEQFGGTEVFHGRVEPGQRIDLAEVTGSRDDATQFVVLWETCDKSVLKDRVNDPDATEPIGWATIQPKFCGRPRAAFASGMLQIQMLEQAEGQMVRVVILPR